MKSIGLSALDCWPVNSVSANSLGYTFHFVAEAEVIPLRTNHNPPKREILDSANIVVKLQYATLRLFAPRRCTMC
jgi:hypothetical protein